MCVCVCERIPCWVAAPVCSPVEPLAASVCQQLPPAAVKHPGEEDKQMSVGLFVYSLSVQSKTPEAPDVVYTL